MTAAEGCAGALDRRPCGRAAPAARTPTDDNALYRFLAENTGDVIVRLDLEGRLLYASPAAKDLFGYAPEDLVGTLSLDLVHSDDAEALRSKLAALAAGQSDRLTASCRARRRDGAWAWIETNFRLVRAPSGRPREVIGSPATSPSASGWRTGSASRRRSRRWVSSRAASPTTSTISSS
jgi:PAS domain S-box-containing protein